MLMGTVDLSDGAEGAFETRCVPDREQILRVRPATGAAHLLRYAQVDLQLAIGGAAVTVASARHVRVRGVKNLGHLMLRSGPPDPDSGEVAGVIRTAHNRRPRRRRHVCGAQATAEFRGGDSAADCNQHAGSSDDGDDQDRLEGHGRIVRLIRFANITRSRIWPARQAEPVGRREDGRLA